MLLALALLACAAPPDTGDTDPQVDRQLDAVGAVGEVVPTVLGVSWQLDQAGLSYVEYGLDGALDQRTPALADATEVQRTLLGLKAGRTYTWRAVTELEDGTRLESPVGEVELEPVPAEVVPIAVESIHPERQMPGGYFITNQVQTEDTWAVIIDRDGDYVWWWPGPEDLSMFNVELSRDGRSLVYCYADRNQAEDQAGTARVELATGEEVHTRNLMGHHDFEQLPDGTVAWLGLEIRDVQIDDKVWTVAGDTIMEAPEGTGEEGPFTQVFNYFDDYRDPWIHNGNFFVEAYNTGAQDWSHTNSLVYEPDQDAYFAMARHLDAMLKIDRSSGELVWELGGDHNQFTPVNDLEWWSGGHSSEIWDGGALVFDNGDFKSPKVSRVVELAWDEELMTVQEVWSYTDPKNRYTIMGGDARKLANGNILVAWTTQGLITEITPTKDVVWTAETGLGAALWRVEWVESLYPPE